MNNLSKEEPNQVGEKPDFFDAAKKYATNVSAAPDKETPDWIITDFEAGANHVWDTYVSPLHSRIKELEQQLDKAQESITKLFKYMDDGVIVRDISRDLEDGWHVRMLHLTMDLKEASQFVKSQPLPSKPENK